MAGLLLSSNSVLELFICSDNNNNNNNNNNECISTVPLHVNHAQSRCTGANTKIQNACI